MKNRSPKFKSGALPRLRRAACVPALLLLTSQISPAGSATWNSTSGSGEWNIAANWTVGGPPNGPADTATFATSNRMAVSLSANTETNSILFDAGADAFTITASSSFVLTISGVGITNNSGITQNFVEGAGTFGGATVFTGSATAGSLTAFINSGSDSSYAGSGSVRFFNSASAGSGIFANNVGTNSSGFIGFYDTSTAGSGTFTNDGGIINGSGGGSIFFSKNATAGAATFTNNRATVSGGYGGSVAFSGNATADRGTIINDGGMVSGALGGETLFNGGDAGNATLIANSGVGGGHGGVILFLRGSRGGTARVEVFGNGNVDISSHRRPGLTTGSIEGSGLVFLGGSNLTVGSNNLSTEFSGTIQDGGIAGGTGGSLTKTGQGKLTLGNTNTYTGGTTVSEGTILVTNRTGSATGTGTVQISAGKLGGTGTIGGNTTVGTGSGPGAFLTPGIAEARPAALIIQGNLTFKADGTYHFGYKSSNTTADKVVARGVTMGSGALLFFGPIDAGALPVGSVFTAIDNTAATPIGGTFANIADGATVTVGSNTFQANYENGDGNDLTLTVVP